MCGIAGILNIHNIPDSQSIIDSILEIQDSRGPDSRNILKINEYAIFGHNRLKIIDLRDISNQPLESNSGRYTIVFNGEIYNFLELKRELKDYDFKTESDTEVILASIEIRGLDWFLKNANGMYSFAIYDKVENAVYLCRDRSGVKPLYYYIDDNQLIFSSNAYAIKQGLGLKPNLNIWSEYLKYRYVRTPETFFEKVKQVESGTYLKIDINLKIKENRYYTLENFNFLTDDGSKEQYLENEIHQLLFKSVERRLIADVKVGSYLSGGVDSSLIAAMAATILGENLSTYTVGTKTNNEFKYARLIAEKYKTNHNEILYTKEDYFNEWPALIKSKGAPLGVPNEVPLSLMTKALSKDITVVLSGEGADELFGGYGRIFRLPESYSLKSENFIKPFYDQYEYFKHEELNKTGFKNYQTSIDQYYKTVDFSSNTEFIFNYFQRYHIEGLLQRLDTSTMRWSIEAREPFLDKDLIKFVYEKVPVNYKLRWKDGGFEEVKNNRLLPSEYSEVLDTPKYILKKVAERYLPKEIIYRRKEGFPIELESWKDDLENMFWELYNAQNQIELNVEYINDLIGTPKSAQKLWMLVNILMFLKEN